MLPSGAGKRHSLARGHHRLRGFLFECHGAAPLPPSQQGRAHRVDLNRVGDQLLLQRLAQRVLLTYVEVLFGSSVHVLKMDTRFRKITEIN